jgi:hypothetical protein
MKTVTVDIAGIAPLLMNRFVETNGTSPAVKTGDYGTPREQATPKAYTLKDGELYVPGENLYSCLVEAGKFHKVGKSKVTTLKTSLLCGGLFVDTPECRLGTKKFEIDSRPVVNPPTGGRLMRHRPRLDKWQVRFDLTFDEQMFGEDFIRQIVDDAGMRIGIGDFRPARKGPFGRFKVVKWALQK